MAARANQICGIVRLYPLHPVLARALQKECLFCAKHRGHLLSRYKMRSIQQVAAKIVQRTGPCSPGNHPPFHFHPGVRQAFAAQAAIQGIQRAKLFLHQFFQHLHRLCKAVYIPHLAHRLRRPACPRQRCGLLCRQGHRLFQKDVLARFQRRHGIGKMRVVRGADDNSVTAFQQFLQRFAHTHVKGKLSCPAHPAFSGAVVNGRNRRPFLL